MKKQEPPMTLKQERFVDAYILSGNASEAVLEAGYVTRNQNRIGSELLKNPKVKAAIEDRLKEEKKRNELTADLVIQKLMNIVNNTEEENPTAALRGLELLGKHLGLYRDRQEISGPDGEAIEMKREARQGAEELTSALSRLANKRDINPDEKVVNIKP